MEKPIKQLSTSVAEALEVLDLNLFMEVKREDEDEQDDDLMFNCPRINAEQDNTSENDDEAQILNYAKPEDSDYCILNPFDHYFVCYVSASLINDKI